MVASRAPTCGIARSRCAALDIGFRASTLLRACVVVAFGVASFDINSVSCAAPGRYRVWRLPSRPLPVCGATDSVWVLSAV